MNKNLSFDVISFLDKTYTRMTENYSFAFSKNQFVYDRAHQILCRFGVFGNILKSLFSEENIFPFNDMEKIFIGQVNSNIHLILESQDWAFPNNNLSDALSYTSLKTIDSSLKNYQKSISLLGDYCLKEKTIQLNLLNFLDNISCMKYYKYAYPEDFYNSKRAHPSLQMLITFTEELIFIFDSMKTTDENLKEIFITSSSKLEECKNHLHKAYGSDKCFNYEIGHTSLTNFINVWKSFKEYSTTSLKSYFEKQEIISSYESKLENENYLSQNIDDVHNINNRESVAKKVKSLL